MLARLSVSQWKEMEWATEIGSKRDRKARIPTSSITLHAGVCLLAPSPQIYTPAILYDCLYGLLLAVSRL